MALSSRSEENSRKLFYQAFSSGSLNFIETNDLKNWNESKNLEIFHVNN